MTNPFTVGHIPEAPVSGLHGMLAGPDGAVPAQLQPLADALAQDDAHL
jgi:hypothetical protein